MKILVLGTDTRSFLTVIRSLGRAGHDVHVAWADEGSAALSSRYIRKRHALAAYREDDPAWLAEFEELLAANEIDLVIPCSDPVIIPLQAIRGRIRSAAKFCIVADETYRLASSKTQMYALAEELGIPLAKGRVVASAEELRAALDTLRGPWVFKPEFSYSAADPQTKNYVRKAHSRDEAMGFAADFLQGGAFQIQENFVGAGTGVEVLCDDGKILLAFQHLRIHEPLQLGGSAYRRGMAVHPGMLAATAKIMNRLKYRGLAMMEFKWNRESDEWIFIEMNARFWGSLPLAVASGADFPRALVELEAGGRREFAYDIRTDLYARNLDLDLNWMITNHRADKRDPTLSTQPWHVVLREFGALVRGKERWDTLTLDDPVPFVREVTAIAATKRDGLVRRIACSARYLALTARGRRRRLSQRLPQAAHVLFVCHGNICRSPFAEACAHRRAGGVRFSSAGFYPAEGREAPGTAIAAARDFEVDLSAHRSRRLTDEMTREADVLFVFDRTNLRNLHFRHPAARAKTFLLSDLSTAVPMSIDDPWGQGLEKFVECYRLIEICIKAMGA